MWTSLSPLLFVICHVRPLSGSKPGCEISNPCFFTNSMYLEQNNWKFKDTAQINGMNFSRNQSSLLCMKVFDPKVFIPNKYVIIRSHDIRMKIPFSIPPITVNREWQKVTNKQKLLYAQHTLGSLLISFNGEFSLDLKEFRTKTPFCI